MGEYLDHERCVALGEIGYNNINDEEEYAFVKQLRMAKERNMPVLIHLPHFKKPEGAERIIKNIRDEGMDEAKILIDHNTEDTMPITRKTKCFTGMTVYPISKLTPERVSGIIREFGSERMIVDGSADWGISDPCSLPKVVEFMRNDGHSDEVVQNLVFNNANAFYSNSPRWKPELELEPVDPREFQR
jgi:predicted metal-dependent TIM-barrel fold hydrolase